MPDYRRDKTPGATWFFTVVSYQRRTFLCDEPVRVALRNAIIRVRKKYPFEINAWVLMPDHFHCIWTLPSGDHNYSLRMSLLKRSVTLKCKSLVSRPDEASPSRTRHREATVWQKRFWAHRIRDEKDLERHLDYIHYNPVKHGHCLAPDAWPYSTLHKYQSAGVYPENWAIDPGRPAPANQTFGEV